MMLLVGIKMMPPQGIKTALYLRLTLNLRNIFYIKYNYSEIKKWKNKINSEGDF